MSSKNYKDQFKEWNDVTGAIHERSSWYYECESILHDADIEIANLKETLEKVTKMAEEVTEFYGDEYNYDLDGYHGISGEMRFRCVLNKDKEERNDIYQYAGKLARQKQKELKEILQKGLGTGK